MKAIWQLRMSQPEADAIKTMASGLKCSPDLFKMTKADLDYQRKFADKTAADCPAAPPELKPDTPAVEDAPAE